MKLGKKDMKIFKIRNRKGFAAIFSNNITEGRTPDQAYLRMLNGQRDPLIEYKAEAFKIFEELMVNIKTEICHNIFRSASSLLAFENFLRSVPQQTTHQATSAFGGTTTGTGTGTSTGTGTAAAARPGPAKGSDIVSEAAAAGEKAKPIRVGPKVGRNDPCPCGSGQKYKQCCGKN